MNGVDRYLRTLRIRAALPWIPPGGHVLDIGCGDGALFRAPNSPIGSGVGIDQVEGGEWVDRSFERRIGEFPDVVRAGESFDAVVLLAVIEHVSHDELTRWAAAIGGMLRPDGRLVITVPSPLVDHILVVGKKLRVLHGIATHQHHGFDPAQVPAIFAAGGLALTHHRRFELGLNHLFVFQGQDQGPDRGQEQGPCG